MSEIDPMRAAQANMRGPEVKRFYKEVSVAPAPGGFALQLDGRGARTPGKRAITAPTRAAAELIAAEWAAQGATLAPAAMPVTRLANSALDGVAGALNETIADIVRYAGSDLVCYRADEPDELVALQAATHDPVLAWAQEALGARFALASGVTFVEQPAHARAAFAEAVRRFEEPFAIAALHSLTTLSGSALLALMTARGAISAQAAWRAAHVDEDFQIARWGEDDEAAQRREARWREFEAAALLLAALKEAPESG